MKMSPLRRVLFVAAALCFTITLVGCGSKVDGKYTDKSGLATIEFKSGKATLTTLGNTLTSDYTVDGDKVTLTGPPPMTLTINKDGNLEGNGNTFTKTGG